MDPKTFGARLRTGLGIEIGPFLANIRSDCPQLVRPLHELYRDYPCCEKDATYSFHVRLDQRSRFPGFSKKWVRFSVDGLVPHEDMPANQALPVLEWGINLVIALRFHRFLMLHSAVLEIDDRAVILPAAPGEGKTTLCAGLALSGWRLFSDEFGLLRPGEIDLIPVPRPMALKNESIEVIREFSPDATIGPVTHGTRKGTVAHVRPPAASVLDSRRTAKAKWIVFPRWIAGSQTTISEIPRVDGFMHLAKNAFNYELLGESAFRTVSMLIDECRCFTVEYSDLHNAVSALTDFVRRDDI